MPRASEGNRGADWLESLAATLGNWLKLWAKRNHLSLSPQAAIQSERRRRQRADLRRPRLPLEFKKKKNKKKNLPQNALRLKPLYFRLKHNQFQSHLFLSIQAESADSVYEYKREPCRSTTTLLPLTIPSHHLHSWQTKSEVKMLWESQRKQADQATYSFIQKAV